MTVILDTSVVIPMSRVRSVGVKQRLREDLADADLFMTAITETELLQGARDHSDWNELSKFMSTQELLQPAPAHWRAAARTFFELRRVGQTVRSSLDCVIAEMAIAQGMQLVHNDRDFEKNALLRPLQHRRLDLDTLTP